MRGPVAVAADEGDVRAAVVVRVAVTVMALDGWRPPAVLAGAEGAVQAASLPASEILVPAVEERELFHSASGRRVARRQDDLPP